MISFKCYTGKSKLQGQKNRFVVARDWDGERGWLQKGNKSEFRRLW